ncbi:MAG: hypothetical protein ACO2ER_03115 [Castellaniella sp.]
MFVSECFLTDRAIHGCEPGGSRHKHVNGRHIIAGWRNLLPHDGGLPRGRADLLARIPPPPVPKSIKMED